jgi:hypothetical protein
MNRAWSITKQLVWSIEFVKLVVLTVILHAIWLGLRDEPRLLNAAIAVFLITVPFVAKAGRPQRPPL